MKTPTYPIFRRTEVFATIEDDIEEEHNNKRFTSSVPFPPIMWKVRRMEGSR